MLKLSELREAAVLDDTFGDIGPLPLSGEKVEASAGRRGQDVIIIPFFFSSNFYSAVLTTSRKKRRGYQEAANP